MYNIYIYGYIVIRNRTLPQTSFQRPETKPTVGSNESACRNFCIHGYLYVYHTRFTYTMYVYIYMYMDLQNISATSS